MMPDIEISRLGKTDIDETRQMQALVWQDHFLKEKGQTVPLLFRSRQNIEYYMEKDGGAFFVAKLDGELVGSIVCHVWGKIGWFGPFEVHPQYQNKGIGKKLVERAIEYLEKERCTTIGLETMSASTRNVTFYSNRGFKPKKMTYVFYKDLSQDGIDNTDPTPPLRKMTQDDLPLLRKSWNDIDPGLDYTTEFEAIDKYNLGEAWMFEFDETGDGRHREQVSRGMGASQRSGESGGSNQSMGRVTNHAILHTYELIDGSTNTILKLLVADNKDAAMKMLAWCERRSRKMGKRGIFLRSYQGTGLELADFLKQGYVLTGVQVRMMMRGEEENTKRAHISCWSG